MFGCFTNLVFDSKTKDPVLVGDRSNWPFGPTGVSFFLDKSLDSPIPSKSFQVPGL